MRRLVTGEGTDGVQRTPAHVLLAVDGGKVVGVAVMGLKGQLWNLLVRREHRLKGIGGELLRRLNPRWVRCKTNMKDGNPQEFYEKAGYFPICQIPMRLHITLMLRLAEPGEQIALDEERRKEVAQWTRLSG